ncbi:MAG TPA: P-loop NTPase fold protein [Pyrinomonadaceae bacterium]|nr:P-loop NTPase fold protein [Pyrinomonadaceae bacterium]
MRHFLISQLTRAVDFLKGPESAPAQPQLTAPETIDATIDELADNDGADGTELAAFFPDKPSPRDYLDFQSYAATLADLIENTQTPLTIGVFGAWGSGKTTLMRMIERSLRHTEKESEEKRFVLVNFEAWKYYKEDALWRAMLLRVLDALRPRLKGDPKLEKGIEVLEQSLYRDVEWKEKGGLTIDWPKLAKAGAGGALKLSFAFVPGASTIVEAVKAAQGAVGRGDVAGDVSAFAEAFQRDRIVHHQSQLKYIDQFQDEFSKLVKRHFAKQRLVIFVDDLDRCMPEKAIEVLEAIKLFLDVEGCVFVLGIDQEVITRGLEARYKEITANGQSSKFSTHYIEKLIQLPFHLPPIEAREIGSYLTLLNVDWPHADCAKVFAEALTPNPRQIKRTVNVFMLLWKLAERRRSSLGQAVTALRLAKVVILQTAYPQVFDHLKSNGLLLKQLELVCRGTESIENIDPILAEAVNQTSLKKLFELLPDDEDANFAGLETDELTAFFSLARRAPVVTDIAKEATAAASAAPLVATPESPVAPSVERPFQLRAPVRDFVGRTREMFEIVSELRQGGPVAIVTGMPGTGKTEFALRVGEVLGPNFPDGQLFVDMQGTSDPPCDPAEALELCIRALAGRDRDLPSDVEVLGKMYRSQLNDKRVLIMLDDAADAAQIRPLMPPKGSALLITSRNALVLPGMVAVTLDQLGEEEAITLFLSISPKVSRAIASDICSLCGYLPPAVRAAASTLASTPDLDPAEYAKQLSDEQQRIGLLGREGVNVTLEASFSLSYSRLPEETKTVLRKLSVFPGTFDAKAEEIICEDPQHGRLSELTKLSLVSFDAKESRYSVHALMRLFAQRELRIDEKEEAGRAHAAHYVEVIKEAGLEYRKGGDGLITGLALFDRERENIEAGFEWSAGRLEAASICSDYAKYASQILQLRKSPKARIGWFTRALEAAKEAKDGEAQLVHLIGLAGAYRKVGEKDKAFNIYTAAREIAAASGSLQLKAEILSSLGLDHRDRNEISQALECFNEQLAISRELSNRRGESLALINLANVHLITLEISEAIKNCEEAISISQELGDLQTEALALGNLGRAFYLTGTQGRAMELYRRQLEICLKLGDRLGQAAAYFNIGLALEQKGDLQHAIVHAQGALEIYSDLESPLAKTVSDWLEEVDADQVTNPIPLGRHDTA